MLKQTFGNYSLGQTQMMTVSNILKFTKYQLIMIVQDDHYTRKWH